MTVVVDTSAILAVLDADDENHEAARDVWNDLLQGQEILLCNNYVIVEVMALVQRSLGFDAVRAFHDSVMPVLEIEWLGEAEHAAATATVLGADRRKLSLVDCATFGTAHRYGVQVAFAFDRHFAQYGLTCLPAPPGAAATGAEA